MSSVREKIECRICKAEKDADQFFYRKDSGKYRTECKPCCRNMTNINLRKRPWTKTLARIKNRCLYKSSGNYSNYGGRGIKCLITNEELKNLWFRDKAYQLKNPSIDRIDPKGHYTYENCRFIELADNVRRQVNHQTLKTVCKKGHPYSGSNLMIDELGHRHCLTCMKNWNDYHNKKNTVSLK